LKRPAGLLPLALALLFAAWCGSFAGGAGWAAAATAHAAVLACAAAAGARWRDSWRLGFPGLLLPWALLAAAGLACWLSPVPRAGWTGLALLPAYLLLPAVVGRLWGSEPARRWGARGAAAAVAVVAGWSLWLWAAGWVPYPSLPVGQFLHLTAWLVLLLPLAGLPAWDRGEVMPWRVLGGAAVLLGAGAVLGGGSLAGGIALALEAALALAWSARRAGARRGRPEERPAMTRRRAALLAVAAALALLVLAAVLLGPGAGDLLQGRDPSVAARLVYWRAGWAAVTESPVVGLGPGATAWTLAAFLRPVPGVNPPAEVVGELHLLPLALAYELGLPGALLAAAAVALFALRRLRERRSAAAPAFLGAGLLGLAGGAVAGLATADWRVAALPLAAAVAAGAALAGGAPEAAPGTERDPRRGWRRWIAPAYALAAALVLAPLDLGRRAYDLAADAPRGEALRRLDRAVALDPSFPLYRARRGWLLSEGSADAPSPPAARQEAAAESARAAEAAFGLAPLWLAAGSVAAEGEEPWAAAAALERACALDPLGALAPFWLLEVGSPLHDPVALASRSLAAEPRLAAATSWDGRPELRGRALLTLATTQGIDEGWRAELVARVSALEERPQEPLGRVDELALVFDKTPADSVSLHAFRRTPWPARLAYVPVAPDAAAALADLPAATVLDGTDPRLFPPTCTGPFAPQPLRKTLWKTW
jgi:hypothetical protein